MAFAGWLVTSLTSCRLCPRARRHDVHEPMMTSMWKIHVQTLNYLAGTLAQEEIRDTVA